MSVFSAPIDRRNFLKGAGRVGATAALAYSFKPRSAAAKVEDISNSHLAWVWQFGEDGPPAQVRSVLAANGLGIILKTHDGTDWMTRYDDSNYAIGGPTQVAALARFFEAGGVPFHAWAVVQGRDPQLEAEMSASVIAAGARSLVLDLEPSDSGSFWVGSSGDALAFGSTFRRLQPQAWLAISPDPRPWQVDEVPVSEFATFSNEFAPQAYWDMFDNKATARMLGARGFVVGPDGITPELTLDFTQSSLGRFGLPIRPVGPGAATAEDWRRFVGKAIDLHMTGLSVWRYGTSNPDVLSILRDAPRFPIPSRASLAPRAPALAPRPAPNPAVSGANPAPTGTNGGALPAPSPAPAQPAKPAVANPAAFGGTVKVGPRLTPNEALRQGRSPLSLPGLKNLPSWPVIHQP